MTACGGNLIGGEIRRNEQSPLCGVATIEPAESRKGEEFPLSHHSAKLNGMTKDWGWKR